VTYSAVDALFRDALSVARFELIKRRQASTDDFCTDTAWDGQRCLNSLMPSSCTGDATKDPRCHYVDILENSVSTDKLAFKSDGLGIRPVKPHYATNDDYTGNTTAWGSGCSDGESLAGRCTIKVCEPTLKIQNRADTEANIKVRWKHDGTTFTRAVSGLAIKSGDQYSLDWKWDGSDSA